MQVMMKKQGSNFDRYYKNTFSSSIPPPTLPLAAL